MKFLLDANVVIAMLRGHEAVNARFRRHHPSDFGLPTLVEHELLYGAFRGQRAEHNVRQVDGLRFSVLVFDREDARHAARIRALLARSGRPIGPYDVLIAGQALARNLTLVTHNISEFERVPGLAFEDWETA